MVENDTPSHKIGIYKLQNTLRSKYKRNITVHVVCIISLVYIVINRFIAHKMAPCGTPLFILVGLQIHDTQL